MIVALADALLDGVTLDEAAAVERGIGIVEDDGVEDEAAAVERGATGI